MSTPAASSAKFAAIQAVIRTTLRWRLAGEQIGHLPEPGLVEDTIPLCVRAQLVVAMCETWRRIDPLRGSVRGRQIEVARCRARSGPIRPG